MLSYWCYLNFPTILNNAVIVSVVKSIDAHDHFLRVSFCKKNCWVKECAKVKLIKVTRLPSKKDSITFLPSVFFLCKLPSSVLTWFFKITPTEKPLTLLSLNCCPSPKLHWSVWPTVRFLIIQSGCHTRTEQETRFACCRAPWSWKDWTLSLNSEHGSFHQTQLLCSGTRTDYNTLC